jgi:hypothetical protein
MRILLPFICVFYSLITFAQQEQEVGGKLVDSQTQQPIPNAQITLNNTNFKTVTNTLGTFTIQNVNQGQYILLIKAVGYINIELPITVSSKNVVLGTIILEKDVAQEQTDNLITLTENDLADDSSIADASSGLLQASRDVFLNKAAFDFGQAFFRVRGYDSQEGDVLINGITMNKLYNGRPDWNNWGGLNDVTRNQEFTNSITPNSFVFGGLLGTTNINTQASQFRPGFRISSSASNRTYTGRLMATYSSGMKNNVAYTVSASRRWATQGYINGTLYDAYSVFGSLEFKLNNKNSFNLTGMLASNRRGRSSALTEEVYELVGRKYNPYWGYQEGDVRNSRERNIQEPLFLVNYLYRSNKLQVNTGVAYQFGAVTNSRVGYYNVPSPDPTYYRYLPSFYINSPIGANFESANLAKEAFLNNPQLHWNNLYLANSNTTLGGKAAYVLYNDVVKNQCFIINSVANIAINATYSIDAGVTYTQLQSENYAEIDDLLGADFHEDIDPFSNTQNDVLGSTIKTENEIFNYNYEIDASKFDAFAQLKIHKGKWNGFASIGYNNTQYQRNGLYQNERFLNNSIGKSESLSFSNIKAKGGVSYAINGRHLVNVQAAYTQRAPLLQNTFINARENNEVVPNLEQETLTSLEANYYLRLPKLKGRFTGYYTKFQEVTDVNFFYVNAGVGSDFVQEVVTGVDKLHLGAEVGLEYQASPTVKLMGVAAIGKYVYDSNPQVTINFDTAGADEDILSPEGNIDLGTAVIKDYKLAQGPQQAYAFGVEYRDPKYWWFGATANYLTRNYANISTITRTESFVLDPETGSQFPEATPENVKPLLKQTALDDIYLLNLVGGKSWLINDTYISVFASINNLFDASYRTGGYEQSRNGNYGQLANDVQRDNPSFGPKYWYGFGRTYFLNVAISF